MLGILIVNTGTAAAPTEEAVRAHLREFLQDRHLINVPPLIWRPILELFILPKRPRRTLDRYIDFWTPEGSPFMLESQAQRDEIARRLAHLIDEPHEVRLAMRYGQPSIRGAIEAFLDARVDRIIVLPMYPQKTIPCAGSVLDEFDAQFAALTKARSLSADAAPEVLRIDEYWREPGYLDALAGSIRRCWSYRPGSKLVMSYHSIPVSYVTKGGDTYPDAAAETLRRTAEILGVPEEDQVIAFQSRFDSRRWVGPMLVPTVRRLAHLLRRLPGDLSRHPVRGEGRLPGCGRDRGDLRPVIHLRARPWRRRCVHGRDRAPYRASRSPFITRPSRPGTAHPMRGCP